MTPEDLVEIELIKRCKYKYARCLDQKLWDEISECFTPDAHAAYSGGGYSFEGREAIVATYTECSHINLLGHKPLPSRDVVVDILAAY